VVYKGSANDLESGIKLTSYSNLQKIIIFARDIPPSTRSDGLVEKAYLTNAVQYLRQVQNYAFRSWELGMSDTVTANPSKTAAPGMYLAKACMYFSFFRSVSIRKRELILSVLYVDERDDQGRRK